MTAAIQSRVAIVPMTPDQSVGGMNSRPVVADRLLDRVTFELEGRQDAIGSPLNTRARGFDRSDCLLATTGPGSDVAERPQPASGETAGGRQIREDQSAGSIRRKTPNVVGSEGDGRLPIEHAALRAGFQALRVLQTPGYRIANSRAPRGSEPATRWPGCQSGAPSALTTSYGPWCIGRAKTTPRLVAGA
jgi:hypothetical protein